jgi:hypothetical protein
MSSIASKVAGFFGLSPAREGPLAGGGAPFIRGMHFTRDIAQGIISGRGQVAYAASQIANALSSMQAPGVISGGPISTAAAIGIGSGAGSAAGPSGDLVVNVDGQKLFTIMQSQLYRYNIRNSGTTTGILKPT